MGERVRGGGTESEAQLCSWPLRSLFPICKLAVPKLRKESSVPNTACFPEHRGVTPRSTDPGVPPNTAGVARNKSRQGCGGNDQRGGWRAQTQGAGGTG